MILNITVNPIGTIYTNYRQKNDMPVQPCGGMGEIGKIIIDKSYTSGLKDLDGFSYIYLIYYFNQSKNEMLNVIPFNDIKQIQRGVFSTRTPVHPNKLGLSLVKLLTINGNELFYQGVDILNETPLIDIKPFVPQFDQTEGFINTGWMFKSFDEIKNVKSDNRF